MTERLVETLLGLFLIYLGYRVGWKGELWTIHRYHTAYVAEQDRMKFCRGCGIGEMVAGILKDKMGLEEKENFIIK